MKKLFTLLALLMMSTGLWGQCYTIDTSTVYWVKQKDAYAIAISNSGKVAVSSSRIDSTGKTGIIRIWNDVNFFTAGFPWDDSTTVTSPKGLAWDNTGLLYVAQTERADSNILVLDASLHIIAAVNNSLGSVLEWNAPRGLATDGTGALYVVCSDSLDHADMTSTIPGTGKLFKITGLPGTPVKQLLLTGLHSPKGISIDGDRLLLSENGSNKIKLLNRLTLAATDSFATLAPMDVRVLGCKAFSSNAAVAGVNIMNANNLTDTAIAGTIANAGTTVGKYGIALNADRDLMFCDNDSNRVIFYRGVVTYGSGGGSGGPCYCATICEGSNYTFSEPGSGSWYSDNDYIVTISPEGIAHGEHAGYTTVRYIDDTVIVIYSVAIEAPLTGSVSVVSSSSDGGTVSGTVNICLKKNRIMFGTGGDFWTSSNPSVAAVSQSGMVWPKSPGSCAIIRTASNSCNSISGSIMVNVINPHVEPITGDSLACTTSSPVYTNVTSGGYWKSNNTSVALIDSLSGIITPIAYGDAEIAYVVEPTCEEGTVYRPLHVDTTVYAGIITGDDTLCMGVSFTFGDSAASNAGRWLVEDTSIASIDTSSGYFTPIAPGSVTVIYKVTNGCGETQTTKNATILAIPQIGSFYGPNRICPGVSDSLHQEDSVGVLTWYTSDAGIAEISPYTVIGVSYGTATLTLYSSNYCATDSMTFEINVDSNISAPVIAGADSVCFGTPFALSVTSGATDGKWHSSNTSVATVDSASGVITGIAEGSFDVSYTVEGPCDTLTAYKTVYIKGLPQVFPLTGEDNICPLASTTFSSPGYSGPGTWSSSNPSYAVVAAGVITGIAAGSANITFTGHNECGDSIVTKSVTVDPLADPGTISGPDAVCKESTVSFIVSGNTGTLSWSSASTTIATVSGGTVGGASAGSTTITVTATTTCGTATATKDITVNPLPNAGTISDPATACQYTTNNYSTSGSTGTITWSSSDPWTISISPGGFANFLAEGTADVIATSTTATCGTATASRTVTVNPAPSAGDISASDGCIGDVGSVYVDGAIFDDEMWYSTDPSVADFDWSYSNIFYLSTGTTTIVHFVSNSCGEAESYYDITVDPAPVAGSISGPDSVCFGATIALANSGASAPGLWSSSSPSIAAVNSSGIVTGTSTTIASTNINYAVSNACGTVVASKTVYVKKSPVTGTITGPTSLCGETFMLFTGALPGGVWTSANSSVATVDASGIVGGVALVTGASTTITYTVATFSCGTNSVNKPVTVNAVPMSGTLSGADSFCSGATITLSVSGANGIGAWSSSAPSIASVNSTGVVTGIATTLSSTDISYTVTNSCGMSITTKTVTVKPVPIAGTITGPSGLCGGTTISLTGVLPGGVWSSASSAIATVGITGIVGGASLTLGASTTISYTVSTFSCGTSVASHVVTISPAAYRGFITGADTVCMLSYDTVRNHTATPGGSWRSRQGRVAFVTATSGIDTVAFQGISAGSDTLVYTVSNSCGSDSALFSIRVNAYPLDGEVVGPTSVCAGSTIILSDPTGTPGGTWTTSNPAIATVNPVTGIVTGVSAGPVVITYYGSTGCGFIPDPYNITVNPAANAVLAPTPSAVCVGSTISLDNTGSYGIGTWISGNTAVATIDIATGVVGGVSAGTSMITYLTSALYCGLDTTYLLVTVNPLPVAGTITGPDSVCAGTTISLANAAPGGIWSSSATSTASVSASGVVTGGSVTSVSSAIISYLVTTPTCGSATATHTVYVKPQPVAATLSGPSSVCLGSTVTLATSIGGGVWSSPSSLVSVNAASGAVTGLGIGTATISYAVTNSCNTAYTTRLVTINTVPSISPITGTDSVCVGATVVASSAPGGGSWSAHFGYMSVLSASGTTATIQGVAAGVDTLTYTATNVCGYTSISRPMRIIAVPSAGFISGSDTMCPGAVATMTNPTGAPGGIWSHPGTILSLSSSGVVSALFPGVDTVRYTVANYCGSAVASHRIVINPLPVAGAISGPPSVCVGASVTLANPTGTPGGYWTSGAGGTITTGGVFTGVTAGPVTVSYQATTPCGTLFAYYTIIVNPLPTVSAISGPSTICAGTSVTVTNATPGGFWSISPTTIATIATLSSGAEVHAITPGGATVSYAVSNLCGTTTVTLPVTVITTPFVSALLGVATVCTGGSTTLYAGTPGGVWSVTNSHASVSSGVVTGISGGTDTVVYTVTNTCGSTAVTRVVTVLPAAGTDTIAGSSIICTGQVTTLTTLSPGGVWSASNGHATVTGGLVTGVSAGTDTIYYAVTNTCGSDTMSYIVSVNTSVTPSITASVAPNDTLCGTAPATFTAVAVNGGTTPLIRWYNATAMLGTGTPLVYGPSDGENIWCTLASSALCRTNDTVVSNTIVMHQYPFIIPAVTVTASADTMVYLGQSITFTAATASCGSSTYQWYINGSPISGATSVSYTATVAGSDAYYCIATCDTPCAVAIFNHSNVITLHTGIASVDNTGNSNAVVIVAPNPNNGTFTISATGLTDDVLSYQVVNVLGQVIQVDNIQVRNNSVHHTITLPDVASAQYLLRITSGANNQAFQLEVLR